MCNILHPLVQPRSQALPWERDCPLSGQCAHHVISYIIQYFPQTATYTYGTVMLLYRHWCSFCFPCWWTWKEDTKFNACILKAHSHSKSGGSIWASVECQCCFWIARGLVSYLPVWLLTLQLFKNSTDTPGKLVLNLHSLSVVNLHSVSELLEYRRKSLTNITQPVFFDLNYKSTILAKIIVDSAHGNRNICLAQYMRAKTAILNTPPPPPPRLMLKVINWLGESFVKCMSKPTL